MLHEDLHSLIVTSCTLSITGLSLSVGMMRHVIWRVHVDVVVMLKVWGKMRWHSSLIMDHTLVMSMRPFGVLSLVHDSFFLWALNVILGGVFNCPIFSRLFQTRLGAFLYFCWSLFLQEKLWWILFANVNLFTWFNYSFLTFFRVKLLWLFFNWPWILVKST